METSRLLKTTPLSAVECRSCAREDEYNGLAWLVWLVTNYERAVPVENYPGMLEWATAKQRAEGMGRGVASRQEGRSKSESSFRHWQLFQYWLWRGLNQPANAALGEKNKTIKNIKNEEKTNIFQILRITALKTITEEWKQSYSPKTDTWITLV